MNEFSYWDIMRPVGIHARNLVARRMRITSALARARLRGSVSVDAMALVFGDE